MAELYKDVDIIERTTITREGLIQKVYRVSATTKNGVLFSLDIPEKEFSKEKVDKILSKRAAELDAIKAL